MPESPVPAGIGLDENVPFFSLKLRYEGETLAEAKLNGKALEVRHG